MAIAGIYELACSFDDVPLLVGSLGPGEYLGNRYFLVRHGESRANVENVIVSSVENGTGAYGLTRRGVRGIRTTAIRMRSMVDDGAFLFSSPLLRCVESSQIIAEELSVPHVVVVGALRERHFGKFEKKSTRHYRRVYAHDRTEPRRGLAGAESVMEVKHRVTGFVAHLERAYRGKTIVFVTHADVGEILQAALFGLGPEVHRKLPKLKKAECRAVYAS